MENLENSHVFKFSWVDVVKGFWMKYPDKRIKQVKFNYTIDMKIEDNIIKAKRIMMTQMYFTKLYTLENIEIDLMSQVLKMETILLKKVNFPFNFNAVETIIYKQLANGNTHYQKLIEGQNNFKQHMSKFSNTFKIGIDIVEEKIKDQILKQQRFLNKSEK